MLRIVGVSQSLYYYHRRDKNKQENDNKSGRPIPGYSLTKQNEPISDDQIKEWLLELIAGEEHAYGYRKLTLCLTRQRKLIINKKKVYRLCKELDILAPQRRIKIKHTRRLAANREITGINQLWEIDVKYGYIAGENRFFYLMCMLDVFDRCIVDYHLGLSCEGKYAAKLVKTSLWKRNLLSSQERPVIRSDNGPQFISNVFEATCQSYATEHERIPPKTPNKNAHIESFHAILERERLTRYEFESFSEAYQVVREFIQFYNKRRIHGSLRDLSPEEFNQQVALGQITGVVIKV